MAIRCSIIRRPRPSIFDARDAPGGTNAAMEIRKEPGFRHRLENSLEDSAFSQFPQVRRRARHQSISTAAIHLKIGNFLSKEWGDPHFGKTLIRKIHVLVAEIGMSAMFFS